MTPIELSNHVPTSHDEYQDIIPRAERQPSAMVDGSGHQGPDPTAHMPPARGRSQQTSTHLGRSHSICKHSSFQMDGARKVAQGAWKGAQQVTLDHKSGFHNVPLATEFWEYFGLCWRGVFNVWTVLCFGWRAYPSIYHSLGDAVA